MGRGYLVWLSLGVAGLTASPVPSAGAQGVGDLAITLSPPDAFMVAGGTITFSVTYANTTDEPLQISRPRLWSPTCRVLYRDSDGELFTAIDSGLLEILPVGRQPPPPIVLGPGESSTILVWPDVLAAAADSGEPKEESPQRFVLSPGTYEVWVQATLLLGRPDECTGPQIRRVTVTSNRTQLAVLRGVPPWTLKEPWRGRRSALPERIVDRVTLESTPPPEPPAYGIGRALPRFLPAREPVIPLETWRQLWMQRAARSTTIDR